MYRATCVLTLMAQRKTAATPVHQHWNYHSSTPSHPPYDHGNRCINQRVPSHWWPSARLSQLQFISTGGATFPHQAPDMNMATRKQMCKPTCVLISMAQRKTAATLVHQHWSQHGSTPSHRHEHGSRCTKQLVYSH